MAKLSTVKYRDSLTPRTAPYFERIAKGAFLGFRKIGPGSPGNWWARHRNDRTGKQDHLALGAFLDLPAHERYDAAKKAAEAWFRHLGKGGSAEGCTVRKACERYLQRLRDDGKESTADDAEGRFKRWVYDDELSARELSKLHKIDVENWRRTVRDTPIPVGTGKTAKLRPRSSSALNRDMTALRAALNLARSDGLVTSGFAWKQALIPVKGADKPRGEYLDKAQRAELVRQAEPIGSIATLLRALCLVPIRPGALAALRARDFDPKLKTLTIGKDKAGNDRKITLPDSTAAFFAEQRKGKLPGAPLIANDAGGHWDKDGWKYLVKDAARAAELDDAERITAYTLRHSVITDLVNSGVSVLTVARLSGTSVAMIDRHYGHLADKLSREGLAALAI
jgi:integrase